MESKQSDIQTCRGCGREIHGLLAFNSHLNACSGPLSYTDMITSRDETVGNMKPKSAKK